MRCAQERSVGALRREVSAKIACDVARIVYDKGYTDKEEPEDIMADIRDYMYQPVYPHYA